MSELNSIDIVLNFLPSLIKDIPTNDNNFLFFFPPEIVGNEFLFGISSKTGVIIFSLIILIQSICSFFGIFAPSSFWLILVAILVFCFYLIVALYAFLSTLKENYNYAKTSYLMITCLFLIMALKYICKSVLKIIEFITPWDGDFLRLNFLIYVFGYGLYLFIFLYFIYILYRYMNDLNSNSNVEIKNNDNEINDNNDKKCL